MTLTVRYNVEADTFLEAMTLVAAMVRAGCRIDGVVSATHIGRQWAVDLRLWEDA